MQTYLRNKQNNDQAQLMDKIQFRISITNETVAGLRSFTSKYLPKIYSTKIKIFFVFSMSFRNIIYNI